MNNEPLYSAFKHVITKIHGIPVNDSDIEKVTTLMHSLLEGTPKFKKLDFTPIEIAGIFQIKEK
jgi:hypothetical protein